MTAEIQATTLPIVGKTIVTIDGMTDGSDRVTLRFDDGSSLSMWHSQDCCESVQLDDTVGDPEDLIGSPLVLAEESTNDTERPEHEYVDSFTWTFYRLATVKGSVTLRWLGESNGYYSEGVDWLLNDSNGERAAASKEWL